MLVLGGALRAPAPARAGTARRAHATQRVFATAQTTSSSKVEGESAASSDGKAGKQKIYVGKGKYVEDEPSKYPDRTQLTGGFAGGEVSPRCSISRGNCATTCCRRRRASPSSSLLMLTSSQVGLKQFVGKAKAGSAPAGKEASAKPAAPPSSKGGLYIGKGKFLTEDLKSKQSIAIKATERDALTGGFAGGERGLRSFLETGEVPFTPDGVRRKQFSPLIVAGVLGGAAVAGGILVTDVSDLGERALSGSTPVSPAALAGLDENTKLLLEVAVLLVGVVGTVVGGRALVGSMTSSIKEGAGRLATLAVFWLVVFVAAKIVLDG